jgi:hypothetical protein
MDSTEAEEMVVRASAKLRNASITSYARISPECLRKHLVLSAILAYRFRYDTFNLIQSYTPHAYRQYIMSATRGKVSLEL